MRNRSALFVVAFAAACALGSGCGGQDKRLATARHSAYNAEYVQVFQTVVSVVKATYPHLQADEGGRKVVTAWHPLPMEERIDSREEQPTPTSGQNQNQGDSVGVLEQRQQRKNVTDQTKRQFVRFAIMLEPAGPPGDTKPWLIRVDGQASEWDGTGVPDALTGAQRPYWLDRRLEKLEVEIYEKLKPFAVAAPGNPR